MKQLTTEVYGLNFLIKGNRLCFIVRSPQGKETNYWTPLNPRTLKVISKLIKDHIDAEEIDKNLTPAQLAEKYQEMMGS